MTQFDKSINTSLLFLLIFSVISSLLAYRIVVKAYDNLYEVGFVYE